MRRLIALVLALLVAALPGCSSIYGPVIPIGPKPPPVNPVPPPDPTPPPVDPTPPPPEPTPPPTPTEPPTTVTEVFDRIVVGATLAEATAAIGRTPSMIPGSGSAPAIANWEVMEGTQKWIVYAVIVGGKVSRKGVSRVESNP